jgi:hypothetical protein
MANIIHQQQSSFWDYDLSINQGLADIYDQNALSQQILVYLATSKGERVYNPNFGSPFTLQIFDNISESSVESNLEILFDDLEYLFPIVVDRDNSTYDYSLEDHSISLDIIYRMKVIYDKWNTLSQTLIY